MKLFVEANGLSSITDDPQRSCLVGAQVLAVHLFSKDATLPTGDCEEAAMSLEYGIGCDFVDDAESMYDFVSIYGMVTPEQFPRLSSSSRARSLPEPFSVDEEMRLLALYLLKLPDGLGPLEPGFAGFEVTSTQLVKSPLPASSVQKHECRPPVAFILSKLGFSFCSSLPGSVVEDFADFSLFQTFESTNVERHAIAGGHGTLPSCTWITYFQRSPMTIAAPGGLSVFAVDLDERIRKKVDNPSVAC